MVVSKKSMECSWMVALNRTGGWWELKILINSENTVLHDAK